MNLRELVRFCSLTIPDVGFPGLSNLVKFATDLCMSIIDDSNDAQKTLIDAVMKTKEGRETLAQAFVTGGKTELYNIYLCKECGIVHKKNEENPCENEIIRQIHET